MTQTQRFCTQCGAALKAGNRFCGSCGQPVEQAANAPATAVPSTIAPPPPAASAPPPPASVQEARPAPQPAAAAAPSEPIIGMVPNLQQHKGFMGVKVDAYNLIVAPTRLIFVFVSGDTMKAEVAEANREAKAQGKKWMGIVAAQMGWLNRLLTKYTQMSIDEILARYPGSFVINNAEIRKVRLGAPGDDESSAQGEMHIETAGSKLRFDMMSMQPQEAKRLLQQTLGGLVK